MGWKEKLLKLNGKMTREKWLLFLLAGVFLMLLSVPGGEKKTVKEDRPKSGEQAAGTEEEHSLVSWDISSSFSSRSYEERLEKRIRELLRSVEGIGEGGCNGSVKIHRPEGTQGGSFRRQHGDKGNGLCRRKP